MREGFRVELVAAEPLVADPVDIAWGPDGKLWVVEMADYPLGIDGRGKPGGRVRYLEDTDGDGRYDRSTVFLEGLNCPNGVMPWRKGVLVTAAPEVLYAEDTDGDGKADVRRALFRGFGEGNQQHRVNHLRWGLDNWVYLANGDGGAGANGLIRSVKTGKEVEIRGHDVRIRPDSGALDVVTGQAQFGRCRDDWGNWFGCNNRNPGWHYALVDHYLRRNPYVAAPPGRITLNPDAEPIPIGRVISYRRVGYQVPEKGAVRGRFTSIGGMTCYRDELLGPKLRGDVFTSDSVFNVVHRTALVPDGVTFRGKRAPAEQHCEFLASDDPWFRNNTLRTGPDGALYVVAMYRLSIEHPEWIEDQVEEILDLRLGEDRGRIYRVVPEGKKLRPIPRLDRLDTTALVEALDSPNGPQRDLAQQMILWRADKAATEPLEAMATGSERALARLHALCTLDGLGALRAGIVAEALADEHPGVRRHAIRLSESLVNSHPALSAALLKLLDDTDPQVRMQLAYSLGEWKDPRAAVALGRMALEYADDRRLLVLVHTWGNSEYDSPLQLESVAARYTHAVFLMGHSGYGDWETSMRVARDLPNVYLELTAVYVAHDFAMDPAGGSVPTAAGCLQVNGIIEYMVSTAGSKKIVFGTDMPWYSPHYASGAVLFAKIDDDARRDILYGNAEQLLANK